MADPGYIDLPSTTHFTYEYNQNWSASDGIAIGAWLRETAERDYAVVSAWFNNLTPAGLPFKVRIDTAPNPLDANAWNDKFKNITLNLGPLISTDFDLAREVLVAEFIEIFKVSRCIRILQHLGKVQTIGLTVARAILKAARAGRIG